MYLLVVGQHARQFRELERSEGGRTREGGCDATAHVRHRLGQLPLAAHEVGEGRGASQRRVRC
eukprot:scaffold121202_cov39-Tisochrysis_lutea.AAC.2